MNFIYHSLLKNTNTLFSSKKNKFLFAVFIGAIVFFISKEFGFFHDDILFGSKVGHYLYEHSIFDWKIPEIIDTGHPPFFGFLLAIFWKLLGQKLWVSHLLTFIFVVGFLYQLANFISHYIKKIAHQFFAFLLIIADPTITTSFVLVNMEIISMFLFFLILNAIKNKKVYLKCIGLVFLSFLSLRYMMLFAGIFLFEITQKLIIHKRKIESIFKIGFIFPYLLGATPGILFVLWRYLNKGYITNPNSPWSSLGHMVDLHYFIRNGIVLTWRYLDFGRIFIMLFIGYGFFKFGKKILQSKAQKELILLAITPVFFIIITILLMTNTVGVRYFISSYIALNLLAFSILEKYTINKKIMYVLLFLGLITGNLWTYPKSLSHAWHNTLGHTPYHALRLKAIDYLYNQQIDIEKVASFFPNKTKLDYIDFRGKQKSFTEFTGKNNYVFYSNVYNLSEKELNLLNTNYKVLKEFHNFNITINIYILK